MAMGLFNGAVAAKWLLRKVQVMAMIALSQCRTEYGARATAAEHPHRFPHRPASATVARRFNGGFWQCRARWW